MFPPNPRDDRGKYEDFSSNLSSFQSRPRILTPNKSDMLLTQQVNPLNYPQPQSMFHVRFPSANVNSKADEMQGRMFYGKERN